jgi:GNAT superfamily N-acetyltransferase
MDLLVKLYALPDPSASLGELSSKGVTIRPAMAYEKHLVTDWVRREFSPGWASECEMAFVAHPIACLLATRDGSILGFACYDCTCRGFFGPVGVCEEARGLGIGTALLLACLRALADRGYGYAVIGGVAAPDFYRDAVGALEIPGSHPGVYRDRLTGR